jgi:hypothetical protein
VAAKRVYLHVGLPKTGTTYLQSTLWANRDRLASTGCLIPGSARSSMWRAASDVLGRRPRAADEPTVEGAWSEVIAAVHAWDGDRVIMSHELLGVASARQAQRIVKALRPLDVTIVVTVRDLASTLPSVWQQEIRKGRTWTWADFLAAVQDPDSGPPTAGVAFWLRFDVARIVTLWGGVVPLDQVCVVVVPTRGAPADVLLRRFAEATGVDATPLATSRPDVNTALGVAETEALRRLNVALAGGLSEREYTRVVGRAVVPALQARGSSTRPRLPLEDSAWVAAKSREVATFLRDHPGRVVGDLEDLMAELGPGARGEGQPGTDRSADPDQLTDAELLAPTQDALVAVSSAYAQHWSSTRRRKDRELGSLPARLTGNARALSYRTRLSVLERADGNKVFGRIARAYLKRASNRP